MRALGTALAVVSVVLALASSALAGSERPTLADLEDEIICPTCDTTLELSNSQIAERMRNFIRERIAAGDSKQEIKDALVAQFGESVLAAPPKEGFNLLAWVLPFVGLAAAGAAVGYLAYRWTRSGRRSEEQSPVEPSRNGRAGIEPELERRLDEELSRFDA